MLMYDYAITFPYEVQLFWRRKATGATYLFFANRYLSLFYSIFMIATSGRMSNSVGLCAPTYHTNTTDTVCLKDVRTHSSKPFILSRPSHGTAATLWSSGVLHSKTCSIFLGHVSCMLVDYERLLVYSHHHAIFSVLCPARVFPQRT